MYWPSTGVVETIHKLQKVLELRFQNVVELHVEEVRKRGSQIKIADKVKKVSDLDTRGNEIIDELKNVENHDLKDMVFRMELTYSEVEKILDVKCIATSCTEYTPPPGIYEMSDNNLMLKSLFHNEVKVNTTSDDIRMKKSNRTTNKTDRFSKKTFFIPKQEVLSLIRDVLVIITVLCN